MITMVILHLMRLQPCTSLACHGSAGREELDC
jgi:hypothetical protein